MLFYLLYKIGHFIANILPLRGAYWLAERVSDAQYSFARKDREAVSHNLSIVLDKDIDECRVLTKSVFRNFGLYLVDFFRMSNLDKDYVKKRVTIEGIENVESVLRENRGVIVLSCHIGSWEMGGVVMGLLGYDISAVALSHMHRDINDFFIRQREEKGLKVITIKSMMKRCVSALLRKGILALLCDRDFTNTGIMLNFFGVPTSIPRGPAILSLKTDSPVVPGFFIRENRFNFRFIFDEPIYPEKIAGVEEHESTKKMTESFVVVMEKYIRKYPDQWLIFRKFWESPVDAVVV